MPWEIRWFYPGKNQDFEENFKSLDGDFTEEPLRDDHYLQSDSDDMGIKVRGGNLEIKLRRTESSNVLEKNNTSGLIEEWIKWIWAGGPSGTTDNTVKFLDEITKGPVSSVHKKRFVRRYNINDGNASSIKGLIPEGQSGFSSEFTKINFNQKDWWSFGFETTGSKIPLDVFKKTVVEVLASFSFKFSRQNSFGYPKWIISNRSVK